MTTRVQTFILTGYNGQPRPGTVTIHEFQPRERWRRALIALGKWWGIALLSVLIPVAHFILVPSFFLYGLWQFFQRLGTASLAVGARGTCPDCGHEQALEIAPRWRTPQPVTCHHCHRGLQLQEAAA